MARKTSRRVAASRRKTTPARKGKKSLATKWTTRKLVSVERFVRSIKTLHDLGLVAAFVKSAKRAKLTLAMDGAALEQVKTSVNKLRQPRSVGAGARSPGAKGMTKTSAKLAASKDPWDFGSNSPPGGMGGVAPLPKKDPWDF